MIAAPDSGRLQVGAFCVLLLAVFTVSAGYGVALPILPFLVASLAGTTDPATVSRHIGLLTGLYTFSLFLFAPAWGRLSDRLGRRIVLIVGLSGFGAAMLAFAFVNNLYLFYAERFFSGMFAAAVVPVASAAVGDYASGNEMRARRLARLSMAAIAGFLLGPMLGGLAGPLASRIGLEIASARPWPLLVAAGLALLSALAALFLLRASNPSADVTGETSATRLDDAVPRLLALALIVAAGLGTFEVGLTLRGTQELALNPAQIGVIFAECSLVMFLAQAVVFSPLLAIEASRWLIAPLLAIMAGGVVALPLTSSFPSMLVVVGLFAASAGILAPVLTYWVSLRADAKQGAELGKQAAATSLGQALGSVAAGMLFSATILPGAPFILAGGVLLLGAAAGIRLPQILAGRTRPGDLRHARAMKSTCRPDPHSRKTRQ